FCRKESTLDKVTTNFALSDVATGDDGFMAGVLGFAAGALLVGGVAAIASSVSKKNKKDKKNVDRHPSNPAAEGFIKVDTDDDDTVSGNADETAQLEGRTDHHSGETVAAAVSMVSNMVTDLGDGPMTLSILLSSAASTACLAALANLFHVMYYYPLALLGILESIFLMLFSIIMLALDLPSHNRFCMEIKVMKS
ncbi:hypothetical protein FOL47_007088, partial [Perkinsus chesapeaki]